MVETGRVTGAEEGAGGAPPIHDGVKALAPAGLKVNPLALGFNDILLVYACMHLALRKESGRERQSRERENGAMGRHATFTDIIRQCPHKGIHTAMI